MLTGFRRRRWLFPIAALVMTVSVIVSPAASANNTLAGGIHWRRVNTAKAQVYWIDSTGPRWPADVSAVDWNQTSSLGSYWTRSCPGSNVGCVPVSEGNYGGTGWVGTTNITYDRSTLHITAASIRLNNSYSTTDVQRRHTICQEEGHALGLNHQYASDSCMNDNTFAPLRPNAHDYSIIRSLYNH